MFALRLKNYWVAFPDFSMSHVLLRMPLAAVFIQQGLSKFPVDASAGAAFGLPQLVWWFVCLGGRPLLWASRKLQSIERRIWGKESAFCGYMVFLFF